MLDLSPNKSKLIERVRAIKGHESMFEDELISALIASKSVEKSEKNFNDTKSKIIFFKPRIERIRKKFNETRYTFSKSKIKKIKRNLYEIENKKNPLPRIEEIEKNLHELEKNLSKN